jgi:ribosomal protein S7
VEQANGLGFASFSLMMKGRNNGKKLMAVRIVAHAFEIIHLLTDQNPIQVSTLPSEIHAPD